MARTTEGEGTGEPTLRHIVLVGGEPSEWAALGDEAWERRLAELGKVAEHVGAAWLVLRPYGAGGEHVELADRTDAVGGCTVTTSVDADGRARLVAAVERLRAAGVGITEAALAAALNAPAASDPDLVVVLGPGHRLPPSLVWELAYSELVFADVAWADLQPAHLERAIDAYTHRHRRFGGLD
ncbi:MAG: undecaprenyl diphosphate synthase family protein [Ilumatobacteraceae bacterium]